MARRPQAVGHADDAEPATAQKAGGPLLQTPLNYERRTWPPASNDRHGYAQTVL